MKADGQASTLPGDSTGLREDVHAVRKRLPESHAARKRAAPTAARGEKRLFKSGRPPPRPPLPAREKTRDPASAPKERTKGDCFSPGLRAMAETKSRAATRRNDGAIPPPAGRTRRVFLAHRERVAYNRGMDTLRTIAFALLLLVFPAMLGAEEPEPALTLPGDAIVWLSPEKGLDMARLAYVEDKGDEFSRRIVIRVLRFDTDEYDFRLFSSRWEGQSIPTMREWAASKALTAAINASMYLKDGQTSTGYMRSGERTNNSRIVSRYGAFFVAGPRENGLPRAAVLDRSVDDWQNLLPRYDIVVQNFRLMGPDARQIWPANGPEHAIAAIAEDMNGRILFLHCSDPTSVHDFVEALKAHTDLNLNSAMYVEGGSEASLLLSLPESFQLWNGMSPASYMFSSRGDAIPLPNILGVIRRQH